MKKRSSDSLHWAHPLVKHWFLQNLGTPTEPQEQGWPSILTHKNTLISAPTGSGKTFAAFLICINELICKSLDKTLLDQTEILYISPLKALSNDIQKNLMQPLTGIVNLASEQGLEMEEIRVSVRTGDTLPRERQAMLKKPPHILVTTPESLYILLTAEKSRAVLSSVKTVIVDEIHSLAADKRGTHLALSLERLEALTPTPPIRIGLSATQKPIELIAHFLSGNHRPDPTVINIGHIRKMELNVEIPSSELGAVAANEVWDEIYDRLAALAHKNRSTLIFVNTRRLAERVAHHLAERLGEAQVAAHHGSLSRKLRLAAETKLKNGTLKALVATASLELGIDIGNIDLVCQIGSPRAISVALQRVGRSGHWHGAISKGALFATTRDELVECAALIFAIRTGDLDRLIFPHEPLDIMAQQIIATCATGDWREDDLFQLIHHAYPYKNLKRETFDSILVMLSEGIAGSRGRYGAYLFRDRVHGVVRARRGSRLTAITSGGAIPENGLFTVIAEPNGVMVGTLDEDFAVESNRGDIILLGTTSWRIRRVEGAAGRVLVEDAHGAPPSVPFWRGEAPGRTQELSLQVANLRKKVSDLLSATQPAIVHVKEHPDREKTLTWLITHCGLDRSGAEQLAEFILQGRAILGAVATQDTVIAERFFDEGGGMQLIIHAPFGAAINKAWGLALRKRFCRSFNFELQAAATDDGINIALAEQHSFPLGDVFNFLHPSSIEKVLTQAVLQSPIFATRWRWDATRSLALVRFRHGKKVPPNLLRMRADDLLAAIFPDAAACQDNLGGRDVELPDHPLVNEAMKDALNEALDLPGLKNILERIVQNKIQCLAIDTPMPSVFSHEILNANPYAYLDDAPLEERRARAVEMRRILPDSVLQEVGQLDPKAIEEIKLQAWPDVRNAEELHDSLQTLIALPDDFLRQKSPMYHYQWEQYFAELLKNGRASFALYQNKKFMVSVEKVKTLLKIYPEATLLSKLIDLEEPVLSREEHIVNLVRGWMQHLGPTTQKDLTNLLSLSSLDIEQALLKLEMSGVILRGKFDPSVTEDIEWCERRLLSRIHRLTLGKMRQAIEPVTAGQFMQWLLKWQHLAPGTQLRGEQGLLEVIRQLQGFEIPANAWEPKIFAKRLADFDSDLLDHLCLSGAVGWGRFSQHSASQIDFSTTQKRIAPTSSAPITFFVREDMDWMYAKPLEINKEESPRLSHVAKNIYKFLQDRGASFIADIVRSTGHLKTEVETGLWELVAIGAITADSFDNLRALIDRGRRLGRRGRRFQSQFSGGRWSLLYLPEETQENKHLESLCRLLLKRYGVVFRDLLVKEKILPRWRELLVTFRRMEDRGEIRGGRFVSGFLGEQFALPYAVESLRASKKESGDTVTSLSISAIDPMNLIGIILPGERISSFSSKWIEIPQNTSQPT